MELKKDIVLKCNQCGNEFIFTINDQEFFEKNGWNTIPKKCRPCRTERKRLKQKYE